MAWLEAHHSFHDKVCALSGQQRLCDQIKLLRLQVRPYTRLYALDHPLEIVGHEHEAIVESFGHSSKAAEKVMRAHVMANGLSIVKVLRTMKPAVAVSSLVHTKKSYAARCSDEVQD